MPLSSQTSFLYIQRPRKSSVRVEIKGFTSPAVLKKNKTDVGIRRNSRDRPVSSVAVNAATVAEALHHLHKQSTSSQNRDFVIQEDFEEDVTTPLSKDTKGKFDFNFMSPFDVNRHSERNGLSVPSVTHGSISNYSNN